MPSAPRRDPPVTACAANLAPRDLCVDGRNARTRPSEPGHVLAFGPDVVELEDQWIGLATVRACATGEDRIKVGEVSRDQSGRVGTPGKLRRVRSPPRAPSSRASPVAVGADHIAPSHLGVNCRDRGRRADQRGDTRGLLRDMVELQNDGIALTTIDARVLAQEPQHMGAQLLLTSPLGCSRLIAVDVATRTEVRGETRSAPPLQAVAEAVEALQWEVIAASTAVSDSARQPYAEPPRRQGIVGTLRRFRRRRREDPAYPDAHGGLRDAEFTRDASDRPPELAAEASCLLLFRILAPHEHMFARRSDGFAI